MEASELDNIIAGRFCQSTMKTGLNGFYYRIAVLENEVGECSVLRNLKFTAGEMLGEKTASTKVTRTDAEQQDVIVRLRRELKCREEQAASRSTAVFSERSRDDKRDRAGSSGSRIEGSSPEQREGNCSGRQ